MRKASQSPEKLLTRDSPKSRDGSYPKGDESDIWGKIGACGTFSPRYSIGKRDNWSKRESFKRENTIEEPGPCTMTPNRSTRLGPSDPD